MTIDVQFRIAEALKRAGIENAVQEANWIVRYGGNHIDEIVRRRCNGQPLQYLLGEWEFYGYPFEVGEGVLIPRPETELLVDLAKQHCNKDSIIFDLCAGSGCVGITIAKETGCKVIAVEKSPEAIKYLKQNVKLNNSEKQVKTVQDDVLYPCVTTFSFKRSTVNRPSIVINAPYLSRKEMECLQKEVTYEPKMALFGGEDGLVFYRKFFEVWKEHIKQAKFFACEVGGGQSEKVCKLIEEIGLSPQVTQGYVVYSIL